MKTYKCRSKRSGEEAQIEAHSPEDAAEIFAEEWGLEDGDIAHVERKVGSVIESQSVDGDFRGK